MQCWISSKFVIKSYFGEWCVDLWDFIWLVHTFIVIPLTYIQYEVLKNLAYLKHFCISKGKASFWIFFYILNWSLVHGFNDWIMNKYECAYMLIWRHFKPLCMPLHTISPTVSMVLHQFCIGASQSYCSVLLPLWGSLRYMWSNLKYGLSLVLWLRSGIVLRFSVRSSWIKCFITMIS